MVIDVWPRFEMGRSSFLITALILLFGATCAWSEGGAAEGGAEGRIILGQWDVKSIERVLKDSSAISDPGERIAFISEQFLGTPYQEHTLVGGKDTQEALVINFSRMDCFTYLDYVEAMRVSGNFEEFKENLRRVRYRDGDVEYKKRNHFFTDWSAYYGERIEDSTTKVGDGGTREALKRLNLREDGTRYVEGIGVVEREIAFIPRDAINREILARLKTGDYIGVYSESTGLDVSHTGIFIRKNGRALFRHASSQESKRRVVDEDFIGYFSTKPGFVVLRAKRLGGQPNN